MEDISGDTLKKIKRGKGVWPTYFLKRKRGEKGKGALLSAIEALPGKDRPEWMSTLIFILLNAIDRKQKIMLTKTPKE